MKNKRKKYASLAILSRKLHKKLPKRKLQPRKLRLRNPNLKWKEQRKRVKWLKSRRKKVILIRSINPHAQAGESVLGADVRVVGRPNAVADVAGGGVEEGKIIPWQKSMATSLHLCQIRVRGTHGSALCVTCALAQSVLVVHQSASKWPSMGRLMSSKSA